MATQHLNEEVIFNTARKIESEQARAEYLAQVCGHDTVLRRRVDALLGGFAVDSKFLEPPPQNDIATEIHAIAERPGTTIGPYKLLQQLGEGGMGVVYMAEQTEPVDRRVALKIIKPGMDSRQVIARFEAERQALAMMDHPHIAKVHDAGATESGRPYFVMELVKGVPITTYCDEQHLTPRQRLELFIPVCQAVQHAHQKGIIHRDLKPSNVLVAPHDGHPVPKVIDFGVAKATGRRLTEKTMFTQVGQVIGTLEYMSPEQAEINQLDVDTRSDVYSLGVLLYELLVGTTPFDRKRLRSAAFDEMLRIIREEDPPKPSMRLSTIETLPSVAANRQTEPQRLSTLVRGDLDWIVMKALDKDRSRRYETAIGFAADIQRHLDDEPVVACPPSLGYRFRKFACRNRALLSTASIVAVAVLLGLIGTTWQGIVATKQRDRARAAENRANQKSEELVAKSEELLTQLQVSRARGLAAHSNYVRDEKPVQSALLAVEAVEITRKHDETVLPIAHQALLSNGANLGGLPLVAGDAIWPIAISPDSRWLVAGSQDHLVWIWDLKASDPASSPLLLSGHEDSVRCVAISEDSRWVASGSMDATVRVWALEGNSPGSADRILAKHGTGIRSMALSPDGRWLATAGEGKTTVRLWDLTDAKSSYQTLQEHKDIIIRVAISHDGHWLASASQDGTARLWDLTASDPSTSSAVFKGHEDGVIRVVFSPNGRWLATSSFDNTARLWDLTAADPTSCVDVLAGHRERIQELAFSPDSHWLATGSFDSTVRVWDMSQERVSASYRELAGHQRRIWAVAFGPTSRWLVTGSDDRTARLWDLTAEDPTASSRVLSGHESTASGVAISPDGHWLVTASWDGIARLWEMDAVEPEPAYPRLQGHSGNVTSVAMSPNGRWLVTASDDATARLLDMNAVDPSSSTRVLHGHSGGIVAAVITADNRWLVTGSQDATARVWDLSAARPESSARVLTGHQDQVSSLAISADSRVLATASWDKTVRLWDLKSEDQEIPSRELDGHQDRLHAVVMSSDGRWLAAGGGGGQGNTIQDATVRLWELNGSGQVDNVRVLAGPESGVSSLAISASGRWLVAGSHDWPARLWDLTAQDIAAGSRTLRGHDFAVRCVAISPDSRWLATGSWDGSVGLWDLTADDPAAASRTLKCGTVQAMTFSADSCWLLTGNGDETARLWDLTARDIAASSRMLRGHSDFVRAVAISRDGRWAVTGSDDRTARLWDLGLDSLIEQARRLAGRELTTQEKEQYLDFSDE